MTSPALQEIVAVLASPAAGDPAQYLLERALAAAALDWRVITCDVSPERLADAVAGAGAMGFRGCLVSGPLRRPALSLITSASAAATFVGGGGLLVREADGFAGHVNEGRAIVEAVRSHLDPAGREVLLLGADLAGRAAGLELALAGVAGMMVADPDGERGAALVRDLAGLGTARAAAVAWSGTLAVPEGVTIVVRTLPEPVELTGLRGELLVADIAADAPPLPEAAAAGCCLVDGQEIRALQAAFDFQALTGAKADVELLREALDEYLS